VDDEAEGAACGIDSVFTFDELESSCLAVAVCISWSNGWETVYKYPRYHAMIFYMNM
jgi:hypothetical protein